MRLCSVGFRKPSGTADGSKLVYGQGQVARHGSEVTIFTHGPVMLNLGFELALEIENSNSQLRVAVIDFPWLNAADSTWVNKITTDSELVVTIENHATVGGMGDAIMRALSDSRRFKVPMVRFGADGVPSHGSEQDVLEAHGLTPEAMAKTINTFFE